MQTANALFTLRIVPPRRITPRLSVNVYVWFVCRPAIMTVQQFSLAQASLGASPLSAPTAERILKRSSEQITPALKKRYTRPLVPSTRPICSESAVGVYNISSTMSKRTHFVPAGVLHLSRGRAELSVMYLVGLRIIFFHADALRFLGNPARNFDWS